MKTEDRIPLLQELKLVAGAGRAEGEDKRDFLHRFYPVSEHLRAFDPNVTLVIGERGAGKSELFRAVIEMHLLPELAKRFPDSRLRRLGLENTTWLSGYPLGAQFADPLGLRRFIQQGGQDGASPNRLMELWLAYLVRGLKKHFAPEVSASLDELLRLPGGDIDGVYAAFQQLGNAPVLALDQLDEKLRDGERLIFVGYDELDTLGGADWEANGQAIRGLMGLWANYSRRWHNLRAKLFIRTDLYRRHTHTLGADLSKLAANRLELTWSDRNLYAMLIKRIANTNAGLFDYAQKTQKLIFEGAGRLGHIPILETAEDARVFVNRMVGPYMGANHKKGLTFNWLLDHVRDGVGRASPRALGRLVEEAANQELTVPRADRSRLLDPMSLRQALDVVSREHVSYYADEMRWLAGVAERLKNKLTPFERKDAEQALGVRWRDNWGRGEEDVRPPVADKAALVDYLLELGVLRARSEDQLDVPDLFLAGLGLKRKGGVRRQD